MTSYRKTALCSVHGGMGMRGAEDYAPVAYAAYVLAVLAVQPRQARARLMSLGLAQAGS